MSDYGHPITFGLSLYPSVDALGETRKLATDRTGTIGIIGAGHIGQELAHTAVSPRLARDQSLEAGPPDDDQHVKDPHNPLRLTPE